MLNHALRYARRGLAVFPLRPRGKEPLTKNGCRDATCDEGQITRWWKRWPDANIGMATGAASGGIVVLDVDNDDDRGVYGSDSVMLWESEFSPVPATWMSLTGRGGVHYLFRSERPVRNRAGVLDGVDVRGDGGYIVVPPSVHPNGRAYEWEASSFDLSEPAELTEDLYGLMTGGRGEGQRFEMPEEAPQGTRNETLFKFAASLQAKGLSDAAILGAALAENRARCRPPLEEGEVRALVQSALRYDKGVSGEEQAERLEALAQSDDAQELLSEGTFRALFAVKSIAERERRTVALRAQARRLKCVQDFNDLLSAYKKEYVLKAKNEASNDVRFTDCPISGLKCGEWVADDLGVRKLVYRGEGGAAAEEWACPHPVLITERLKNVDTGDEKLKLAFYKDGRWQTVVANRTTTGNTNRIIDLADRGVQVNSVNARPLVQFLCDLESFNQDKIPAYKSIGRLGWSECGFSPYAEGLRFDGEAEFRDYFDAVKSCGEYGKWLEVCREIRQSGNEAKVVLAAGFASPLVEKLHKLPFIVHLWGGSESAKTVAAMASASIWGDPALGRLVRSFNGTKVGVEQAAAFCSSVPLYLDELQTIKKGIAGAAFDEIIYMLGEGQGRARGKAGGGLRRLEKWRLCAITTGEQPLTGEQSGGGAKNRVLELECKQKLFRDAPRAANTVQGNYGFAGRLYADLLRDDRIIEEAAEAYDAYYGALAAADTTEKQAMAAAMVLTGDFLATRYIFRDGDGLTVDELAPCLAAKKDVDTAQRAYRHILSWLAQNEQKFNGSDGFETWGKKDMGDYVILPTVLRSELERAGYSCQAVMSALADRGLVKKDADGKNTVPARIGGVVVRCYRVMVLE